jgi:Arc/MetJ family transcription regulator
MRTNIVVDDQLMAQALKLSGFKTKKQAVEEGLRLLIAMKKQESIRQFRGKLTWEGDLDSMRKDS